MEKTNTALSLVVALGAYCPKVKVQDPLLFERQRMKEKRRVRPMKGRGSYGESLMHHFAQKKWEAKQEKVKQLKLAA